MIRSYIAHPYSAPTHEGRIENRRRARKWAAWAALQGLSPVCSWISITEEFEETPELREMGLRIDCAQVEMCELMFLCGGSGISGGMLRESGSARVIVDFTWLGAVLPPTTLTLAQGQIISFAEAERRASKSRATAPTLPPPP